MIIKIIANPIIQAMMWGACVAFAVYFAFVIKRLSFGQDSGTKAWNVIALGLFLIGLRVSFKVLFPSYNDSYFLQMLRFSIGIIGISILYAGLRRFSNNLKRLYGGEE